MSCNNLKPPTPPSIENLPSNIKPPIGGSIDKIKSAASGKGLSDAMSNVGGLVTSNLKNAAAALSPENIASKVGELIGGIANTITSTVDGVIDGISGLKGQLKSINPKAKLSQADKLKADIASKADGVGEMSELQSKLTEDACAKKYISQASDVNKDMTESATSAIKELPRKDRAKMVRDPDFKQQKSQEIQDKVKSDASDKATGSASSKDKDQIDIQEKTQQPILTTVKRTPVPPKPLYVDSWISKLVTISTADDDPEGVARREAFDVMREEFMTKLQTGGEKDNTIIDGYNTFHPDLITSRVHKVDFNSMENLEEGIFTNQDLTSVFARQCGQTGPKDYSWNDNPELSESIKMLCVFSAIMEESKDSVIGVPIAGVKVYVNCVHTVYTPNPILGRYYWKRLGFGNYLRAQGDTPLDAYKNAITKSFDKKSPLELQNELYSV